MERVEINYASARDGQSEANKYEQYMNHHGSVDSRPYIEDYRQARVKLSKKRKSAKVPTEFKSNLVAESLAASAIQMHPPYLIKKNSEHDKYTS